MMHGQQNVKLLKYFGVSTCMSTKFRDMICIGGPDHGKQENSSSGGQIELSVLLN
jgi:hypothetical protein